MSLTCMSHPLPALRRRTLERRVADKAETPLLANPVTGAAARAHVPDQTNPHKISLDEWALFEERLCPNSGAKEAVQRIRDAKRDGTHFLNLAKLRLRTAPPLPGNFPSVTSYRLGQNNIRVLPEDLGDMPSLKLLTLDTNGLRKIPALDKYPNLRMVNVSGNPIRKLPPSWRHRGIWVLDLETLLTVSERIDHFWLKQKRRLYKLGVRLCPAMVECVGSSMTFIKGALRERRRRARY